MPDDDIHEEQDRQDAAPRESWWTRVGTVATIGFGVIGIGIAIWAVYFREKAAEVSCVVLSNAPVLSVRQDVAELEIIFRGKDIRKTKQLLSLLTLEISNEGNIAVRKSDFDERDPVKIMVKGGELVRAEMIDGESSEYFDKVFKDVTQTKGGITLPSFVMEPGQSFQIKLLVLHKEEVKPELESFGTIAGAGAIEIRALASKTEEEGGVSRVAWWAIWVGAALLAMSLYSNVLNYGLTKALSTQVAKQRQDAIMEFTKNLHTLMARRTEKADETGGESPEEGDQSK